MPSDLDSVLVHANCSTCGAGISAPYVQVRRIGIFACGCGTLIDADMSSIASQALLGVV